MRRLVLLLLPIILLSLAGCGGEDRTTEKAEMTELDAAGAPAPDSTTAYPIQSRGVYGIQVGDTFEEGSDRLEAGTLENGEGTFDVHYILARDGQRLGYFMPALEDPARVGDITITSPEAATEAGIRVGDPFSKLQIAYPNMRINGSEVESRTYAFVDDYAFRLDTANGPGGVDPNKVPAKTKIVEIVVIDQTMGDALEI